MSDPASHSNLPAFTTSGGDGSHDQRLARLVASLAAGRAPFPVGLPPARAARLAALVRRARRARLVRLVAAAIAADLVGRTPEGADPC